MPSTEAPKKRKRRKPRKPTNSKVPAKGRLRDMADQLWSLAVRSDWSNRCAVCGNGKCEAHHLVPRQHQATRYALENGVALCAGCHKFDKNISPHLNAAAWLEWLRDHWPIRHAWYIANPRPTFDGVVTPAYYCGVILNLKQYVEEADFDRIVGVKFGRYLEDEFEAKQ